MRSPFTLIRRARCLSIARYHERRPLLTLAIETSCDDTSVAILEKQNTRSTLHFHEKVTSDNRAFQGVHPLVALESHQKSLALLVNRALQSLPERPNESATWTNAIQVHGSDTGYSHTLRKRPDFITVTRGPGMQANLMTGLDTAKGLAVAWQIPILGVNHMQAHALTPRLVSSLNASSASLDVGPAFPFLSLLVSGGNTMLVHSSDIVSHSILAEKTDIPVGNVLDKCARDILPASLLDNGKSVMYGQMLETFGFPGGAKDDDYAPPATQCEINTMKTTQFGWALRPPLSVDKGSAMEFSYSGLGAAVRRIVVGNPAITDLERRVLAQETMRVAFEHLASRVLLALSTPAMENVSTLVVSGGVASNQFLKHVLRTLLNKRGFGHVEVIFPPISLCTDNAAMIAWTGMEMWEAGWKSGLDIRSLKKWAIDPLADDGGIMGAEGWMKEDDTQL
jgi:N6-L-threonylcarbamoyladenine synthase